MRQAELKDFGRCGQLSAEAIADPDLNPQTAHHGFDLGRPARRNDGVIDASCADEDPVPPVACLYTGAGFIALDDLPRDDLSFDLFGDWLGLLSRAFEDRCHGAFTQLNAVQSAHRLDDSLIAQMLRLFVKDDRRLQIRTEI